MKMSKIVVLALIAVAVLAAGSVLVAGYVEKPSPVAKATCGGDCDNCPAQCDEGCCDEGQCCCADQAKTCCADSSKAACGGQSKGCCQEEAPAAQAEAQGCGGCPMMSGCAGGQ